MKKYRIRYVLLVLLSIFLLLFYHDYFAFLFLFMVLGLPVFSYFIGRYVWQKGKLEIHTENKFYIHNEEIPIEFELDNPTIFPLPNVEIHCKVFHQFYPNEEEQILKFPFHAKEKRNFIWNLSSMYCGNIHFIGETMYFYDYLNLFCFKKELKINKQITVMPKVADGVINMLTEKLMEGIEQSYLQAKGEDLSEVIDVRQYRIGDRLQRIHWKLTSKEDEIMVKEYGQEAENHMFLLLELYRKESKVGFLNSRLVAFYSLAKQFIEENIEFQVAWFDDELKMLQVYNIEDEISLYNSMMKIYQAVSYDQGYFAYENFVRLCAEKKEKMQAIYFADVDFQEEKDAMRIGMFENDVVLLAI